MRIPFKIAQLRFALFAGTWLIYALFSYPFPKAVSYIELLIGFMLVLFVGAFNILYMFYAVGGGGLIIRNQSVTTVPKWLYIIFMYWLIVPLAMATFHSWEIVDILRDLIPLFYLFLPVMMFQSLSTDGFPWRERLPWLIAFGGVIFSVRYFIILGIMPWKIGSQFLNDELNYMPYEPSVLYGLIFLMGSLLQANKANMLVKTLIVSGQLVGGILCFASLAGIVQRAPLGLAVISLSLLWMGARKKEPYRFMIVAIILAVFIFSFAEQFSSLYNLLEKKQSSEGAGAKGRELVGVIAASSESIVTILFGAGWGSLYFNPVLKGPVRFTHSLLSYSYFKVGFVGFLSLLLVLLYLAIKGARPFVLKLFGDPAVLAGISTILIGLLLQPTYKVLSYGLIILVTILRFRDKPTQFKTS